MENSVCENCKKLEKRIKELERRLAAYENAHTPSSRRRFPKRSLPKGPKKKRGAKKGHKGVTRKTPIPTRTVIASQDKCPGCHNELGLPTEIERRVVEEIPKPQPTVVTEFLLEHYDCIFCGMHVAAAHPECPEDGRFGKNAMVHSTLMKFDERLPYRKVCETLKRNFGLNITPASVMRFAETVSEHLEPYYKKILENIRNASVVYVDETIIKVDGITFWIWAFSSGSDEFIAIRKSRGRDVLDEVLGKDFKGIIICDGLRSYKMFSERLQRCWSHLLRDAEFAAESSKEGTILHKALKRMYNRNEELLSFNPLPDEREDIRKNSLRSMKRIIRKEYKNDKVRRVVAKITNGMNYWFTYVTNPLVEPTNNRSERVLREHVVQRKIFGTLRNERGIKIHERVMSVMSTWKNCGINVFDAMVSCL